MATRPQRPVMHVATAAADWLPGYGLVAFEVAGTPLLLCDWIEIGVEYTALRFVVICDTGGPVTVTPQAAYASDGPAEVGTIAPEAFVVGVGESYGDPYGIDEMRPFWRLSANGTGTGRWGVLGVRR